MRRLFENLKKGIDQWRNIELIKKLHKSGQYLESNSICNKIIVLWPNSFYGYYYRGLNNEKLKLFKEAITDFEIAEVKLHNDKRKNLLDYYFAVIPLNLSHVHFKNQDIPNALQNVDRAIAIDTKSVEALNWRSTMKEDLNDIKGAIEDINEGLKRKPNNKGLIEKRNQLTYILTSRVG